MVIKLKNQRLTIDQIKNGKINKNLLSSTESTTIDLVNFWLEGKEYFELKTSGSTGKPQIISLHRDALSYSAKTSMLTLDPKGVFKNTLLCINPGFIGGMMVVIRAIIHGLDLIVTEPQAGLPDELNQTYDLASMVPLQIQTLLEKSPEKLSQFRVILIGGAPLPARYQAMLKNSDSTTTCYQTYGMTETASHIALKNLTASEEAFHVIGDIQLDQDHRECLKIKGTVTNHQWVQTNDVVEILSSSSFLWKGRADFVINSGGVKIHPESLEEKISQQITQPYFIGSLPDSRLGEKVALFIESDSNRQEIDFSGLYKYEKPREIIYMPKFIYTSSGKVNRLKTIEHLKKWK